MADQDGPRLAVFASERGPGDAERSSIMQQAGTYFARHGAHLVCLAEGNAIGAPLITAARAAGGDVLLIADMDYAPPSALSDIPVERIADPKARLERVAALANAFVGLPGSLVTTAALYQSWLAAGGGESGKPVVLLNRRGAFEILRGWSVDILAHGIGEPDRIMQFSDNIEDLWSRLNRMLAANRARQQL
jgi:predicted Rossmann-fold nucleotide-binding protein